MKLLSLLLVFASLAHATTYTVCATGCDYSSLVAAIAAPVADGSILELRAGETFAGAPRIPTQRKLTIRSSRWRELPPAGYRIDPVLHAHLLATVATATNGDAALFIGAYESTVAQNGVDTSANTITFDYAPANGGGFSEGAAITCFVRSDFSGTMPAPLTKGTQYFIRDWSAGTGKLALSPGGTAIDITTVGSAANASYKIRPVCTLARQTSDVIVQGMRFYATPGVIVSSLVQVGYNSEPDPLLGPRNIQFRHSIFTGDPYLDYPQVCLALYGGADISVTDSWVGHCKLSGGNESKAVSLQNVIGVTIRNNYLSGASINVFAAGADSASSQPVQDVTIVGNFIEKQGYMMYKEGSSAPTGECYYGGGSGAFYRRTSPSPNTCANGACYTCQADKIWALDTGATYRATNFLNKNFMEFKDCERCRVEGNYFRGSYAGPDGGQGGAFGLVAGVGALDSYGFGSGYHRGWDVTWRNNWVDYSYSGFFLSAPTDGGATHNQLPLLRLSLINNLFTHVGEFPSLSQHGATTDVQRYALKLSAGHQGFTAQNNTFRGSAEFGLSIFAGTYLPAVSLQSQYTANIFAPSTYTTFVDNSTQDCNATTGLLKFVPNDGKRFRGNVLPAGSAGLLGGSDCTSTIAENTAYPVNEAAIAFESSSDHHLAVSSPYSAENGSPTFLAPNGQSLGVDVDEVMQYAVPARDGMPPFAEQLKLKITPSTTTAEIRFRRPVASTCTVSLYTSAARSSLAQHADTTNSGDKLDSRASSTITNNVVLFSAGAVSALTSATSYWYAVDCGSGIRAVGTFRTN